MNPLNVLKGLVTRRESAAADIIALREHAATLRERKGSLLGERTALLARPIYREDLVELVAGAIDHVRQEYPDKLARFVNSYTGFRDPTVGTALTATPEVMVRHTAGMLILNPYATESVGGDILLALLSDSLLAGLKAAIEAVPWDHANCVRLASAREKLGAIDGEIARIDAELAAIDAELAAWAAA